MPAARRLGSFAAAAAALATPSVAFAHGTLQPSSAPAGASERFAIVVLNGRADAEITEFRLTLPPGFELEQVEQRLPRWQAVSSERAVAWRGGPIERRAFETFAFRAKTPPEEGTHVMTGQEVYDDGAGPVFRLPVAVTADGAGGGDAGDRTLGKAALGVSIGAAAIALTAIVLAFAAWNRSHGRSA